MRCADLDELISAYADRQTVPAQSEVVEAHLAGCARCTALFQKHRQTRRLLRLAYDDAWTPPDMRLRVARGYAATQRHAVRPTRPAALAAGLCAMVLALGLVYEQAQMHQAATSTPAHPVTTHQAAVPGLARPAVTVAQQESGAQCYACIARALARHLGLPAKLDPLLLTEVALANAPERPLAYPPLPDRWPTTSHAAGTATTKGGEAHQRSVPSYPGLQPS